MLNSTKLYTKAKILNGVLRSLPRLAPALRSHPPWKVSSKHSLFTGGSRVMEGSLHRLHPVWLPRYMVCFRSAYSTSPDHGLTFACWNCGDPAPSSGPFLSCGSCRAVQPVDSSVDYFHIFGQEQKYDLKDGNLEAKYKEWQKKLHPDLVHTKSEREKSYAAEQSARVIDAYRTLSDPLSRALYLLQLSGVIVDEEKTIIDPELLAEMMDVREAVEEASDRKVLLEIQCQMRGKHEEWSNYFRDAFDRRDFDSAISATQRMRYYDRAMEEIVRKL